MRKRLALGWGSSGQAVSRFCLGSRVHADRGQGLLSGLLSALAFFASGPMLMQQPREKGAIAFDRGRFFPQDGEGVFIERKIHLDRAVRAHVGRARHTGLLCGVSTKKAQHRAEAPMWAMEACREVGAFGTRGHPHEEVERSAQNTLALRIKDCACGVNSAVLLGALGAERRRVRCGTIHLVHMDGMYHHGALSGILNAHGGRGCGRGCPMSIAFRCTTAAVGSSVPPGPTAAGFSRSLD